MPNKPRITILNVEDYTASREATSDLLRQTGYTVIEAATGQEALRLAESDKPHLVLLDVKLPDLNGYEVCQRLKADPATSSIPVLQISGSLVEGQDKARGLDSGADAYLLKPVNPAELLATIRALLRMRQAELQVRESEERLRTALDAAVLGMWDLNLETDQIIWGGHHAEIFGLPPDTEMVSGAEFLQMVHPADRGGVNQAMALALAEGERYRLDYRIIRPTGEVRWINTQGQVHCDATGRALRIVGIVRDITDRKLIEVERERLLERERAARAEAEAATRAKDEFLALVSHELRTPLSSMLGWAQMLQARSPGTLPEVAKLDHALTVIERNARSQLRLIEDLLDVARIISGKLRVEPRLLNLTPLLETVCEGLRPAAEAKGIQLQMADWGLGVAEGEKERTGDAEMEGRDEGAQTTDDGQWTTDKSALRNLQSAFILGDPDRIQQIIWNLLSNAIKFTPTGGQVEVRATQNDSHIILSVRDSGKGISSDFLPFIFERFRQAPDADAQRQGLGLGLALTQHLVELHGGTVQAESEGENKGATFTVRLPLAQLRNADRRVRNEEATWLTKTADSEQSESQNLPSEILSGMHILLVEDDEFARELVQLMLEQAGGQVTTAASVKEAMNFLTTLLPGQHPDVLVSDISMPEEDGYALIQQVRALTPERGGKMFAVALTAYGRPEDRVRVMAAGFHTHVVKPVEPEELIAVVASLVGRLANKALA